MLRDAENVTIAPADELLKSRNISGFCRCDQSQLITDRLAYFWLDCTHWSFDAGIFTLNGRAPGSISYFTWGGRFCANALQGEAKTSLREAGQSARV
jgi:hypothetical protein